MRAALSTILPAPGRLRKNAWMAVMFGMALFPVFLGGCSNAQNAHAGTPQPDTATTVGVTPATRKPITRQLTLSSELVPFEEIDVYAKESGYVRDIKVDYGSRVKKGDLMATLE